MNELFSERQQKVSRLLQKELSGWFQRNKTSLYNNTLITVTIVRVTKDLSLARVYLSFYFQEDTHNQTDNLKSATELVKTINEHKSNIRGAVGYAIAKQVRIIPDFQFFVDDSLAYTANINKLLS